MMKSIHKTNYETPEVVVLEVQSEGIICGSAKANYTGFGTEEDWSE